MIPSVNTFPKCLISVKYLSFFVEKQLHHLDVNLLPRREKAVNLLTKVVSKNISITVFPLFRLNSGHEISFYTDQ